MSDATMASNATSPRFAVDYVHADNPDRPARRSGRAGGVRFWRAVPGACTIRVTCACRCSRMAARRRSRCGARTSRCGMAATARSRGPAIGKLAFGVIEVEEGEGGIEAPPRMPTQRLTALRPRRAARRTCCASGITSTPSPRRRRCRALSPVLHRPRARAWARFDPSSCRRPPRSAAATMRACCRCTGWPRPRPGPPVENPRQVSAYRYPRAYGPQPPSFARAMLPPTAGSAAAALGHRERGRPRIACSTMRLLAQLDETFANFDSLLAAARQPQPALPRAFGSGTRLKVYVRDRADLETVAARLDSRVSAPGAAHRAACGDLPARTVRRNRWRAFGLRQRRMLDAPPVRP